MLHTQSVNPANGTTVVDFMSLLGRCLGSFQMVERVLATFRDSGTTDLAQLKAAIYAQDYAAIVEISHRFKGAAGNVSATRLRDLLANIEQFSQARDGQELLTLLSKIESEWTSFRRFTQVFAPGGTPHTVPSTFPVPHQAETQRARTSC